jgi:hypothetical protein
MKIKAISLVAVSLIAALSVGCAGVTVAIKNPPAAGAETVLKENKVAAVSVSSASELQDDKQTLITKNQVPTKLETALMDSLGKGGYADKGAGALKVAVNITEMRLPAQPGLGGADHVAGTVTVTDAAGATVKTFDAQSTSTKGMFMGGSRASRFSNILSDFAQKIVDGL